MLYIYKYKIYLISIADEEDPDDPGLPVASSGLPMASSGLPVASPGVPVAISSGLSSRGNY